MSIFVNMRKGFLLLGLVIFLGSCIDNQPWKPGKKTTQDTSEDLVTKKDVSGSKDLAGSTDSGCLCQPGEECDDGICKPGCEMMECEVACIEGVCVACTEDADCTDINNARCETDNTCQPCTEPEQCEHFGGEARCTGGICQCGSNDDCESGEVCDTRTLYVGNCRIPGTKNTCEACIDDSECASGYCLGLNFRDEPDGKFCVDEMVEQCSGPYVENTLSTTGGIELTFCTPNPARTTCDAVLAYGNTCADDPDCGEKGGSCIGTVRCSFSCKVGAGECPGDCVEPDEMGFGYCE